MNVATLKERFFSLVAPDLPNEWDVEEALKGLADIDEERCDQALRQVPVIWPVSHSLCFDYLKTVAGALACLEPETLPEWVNRTLDQYEKDGLRAAQRFMADVDGNFLCPLRGERGVSFQEVRGRLLPYLRGLSGRSLDLAPGNAVYTDTATVFVPREITRFENEKDNIFLYKLIVSYQWGFIACASYLVHGGDDERAGGPGPGPLWLQDFFTSFSDPEQAAALYHLLETFRVRTFLGRELPGLMSRAEEMLSGEQRAGLLPAGCRGVYAALYRLQLGDERPEVSDDAIRRVVEVVGRHGREAVSAMDSVKNTGVVYRMIEEGGLEAVPGEPLLFQGEMRLEEVRRARDRRLDETGEQFIDALALRLLRRAGEKEKDGQDAQSGAQGDPPGKSGGSMITEGKDHEQAQAVFSTTRTITIDNEQIPLDEELEQLSASIVSDLGYLPERYVSSAVGRAGSGYGSFHVASSAEDREIIASITYDEWDYRRQDFRKNWCRVVEKEIPLTRSGFHAETRARYHGQIVRLRYQFEMLRTGERFVRRQRDGDDIDLDALVESVGDARAGLAPSDRLFVRLQRDERDIAVLFLVDMSNSTQGWVNKAIRESLVLLCEALEVVGDRYGIYGFSGMRRLRSEFFHIKHLDEPYGETVRQRISSIAPREYTRMGPALRHATSILAGVEARVRLLITLSDGKPEDYDDYKGEYAVEDTRHALIEARATGIHPFCITVDRYAQEYIAHMYGGVNYILIDDVAKLPRRMPEIYRVLTT
ncbi:MAG: hypothetical protein Kow0089_19120 [Desulfobulbaceae bacterium]